MRYRLRNGKPAPFCFIPRNPEGVIPVPLTEDQESFLRSLDPRTLTPGDEVALRKAEGNLAGEEDSRARFLYGYYGLRTD